MSPRRAARLRAALAVAGLAVAAALALWARSRRPPPSLAIYGEVPAFILTDQRGQPFSRASMLGHVSVVDFIFTRCRSSCPRLTATMAELEARLSRAGSDVRLVSFSVDPENDTPAVLTEYAAHAGADPARWSFVTGSVDDVTRTVVLGFKVSAAKIAREISDYDVIHGDWFVLVDRAARIRGYYETADPGSLETVMKGLASLAHEPSASAQPAAAN